MALARARERWSLEELAGSRLQQQALTQVCGQLPLLRETLDAAQTLLLQQGAVVVEGVPARSAPLVVAASAMAS